MPLPVRVAAGLVVTALEQARKFPEQLAELPVTAASRAVQAGMRVQQRVTELAIKGDEVFSLFRRVEDTPPWARFDEDDEPGDQPREHGHSQPHINGSSAAKDATLAAIIPGPGARYGEIDEADVARGLTPAADDSPEAELRGEMATPASGPVGPGPDLGAATLSGYDELSLAQLRGKLRGLSLPDLEALLDHEHAHQDRAPFVTMLSNRIVTVRSR